MCIENLTINNNSRLIYLSSYPKLKQNFKCGKCFECRENRSNEYLLRGYYQAKYTFNKSGYCLFDTLTYSDKYVPHINDLLDVEDKFFCFRVSDIVNFIKLIRIRLRRLYKENGTLNLLYSGEYGTDEGCTHRPHYHVIFYYTGKLNFYKLSLLISDCWKYGRTDGVKYKGYSYVKYKRYFTNENDYCLNQLGYIVKYVEKEAQYEKIIEYRTNKIIKSLFGNDLNYFDKLESRKLRNLIRQSQRCSKGFGEFGLNFIDDDELIRNNNLLKIPDTKNVIKWIPLPTYYKRKLYQNLMYYNIGNVIYSKWIWNERGRNYAINIEKLKYNNLLDKYKLLLFNSEYNKELSQFCSYKDLANYVYINQNRYGNAKTIDDVINNMFNDERLIYSWGNPKDKCINGGVHYINDKPNLKTGYEFKKLGIYQNELYEYIINTLYNEKRKIKLGRNRLYFKLKELKNRYKYLGLK